MEQLAKFVLVALVVSVVVFCGGLWLLHAAINEGNGWKGVVAVIALLLSGPMIVRAGGIFGG